MTRQRPFQFRGDLYRPSDAGKFIADSMNHVRVMGNHKGVQYYNVACAFDIETTSFYRDDNGTSYSYEDYTALRQRYGEKLKMHKCAIMYIWQLGINGYIMIGRTWVEFLAVVAELREKLGLNGTRRLIVYVHNLGYEFQFMRHYFEWDKVFSTELRQPLYAISDGIEFRCSYILSGYSLDTVSKHLLRYKCSKLVGHLDYHKLRHSGTLLTDDELAYCINDVRVVMGYIQELIEQYGGIAKLPLTHTGFVRKYCRANCLRVDKKPNYIYHDLIRHLNIGSVEEFSMLHRAFAGGFTHANAIHVDQVLENVDSYDFTSSYPYVMISEQFPMSSGIAVDASEPANFRYYISHYCCIFDVEFTELLTKLVQEQPLSESKCYFKDGVTSNNGRVVTAAVVVTTLTNIDYEIFERFYSWKTQRVIRMYIYRRAYLPTDLAKCVLGLYEKKTRLKGVDGMSAEYQNSKEMLNSCYGMCVTNPLKRDVIYDGDWGVEEMSREQMAATLDTYNRSRNRFLFYAWGVFVTAYARRNLFTAIQALGDDYVYADTDSVKLINGDLHKSYFDAYNQRVRAKLIQACRHHMIPFEKCAPKTITGKTKLLGVWDYEGRYKRFKTLGAKRYLVEKADALTAGGKTYDYSLTVAGLNKFRAIPYMLETYGADGIFDAFSDYLDLPPEGTGDNIVSYIDYPIEGTLVDTDGVEGEYQELSGVHIEPIGYNLNMSTKYMDYIIGIKFKG